MAQRPASRSLVGEADGRDFELRAKWNAALLVELKYEIRRKSPPIAFHLFIEAPCLDSVELRENKIEDHPLPADGLDRLANMPFGHYHPSSHSRKLDVAVCDFKIEDCRLANSGAEKCAVRDGFEGAGYSLDRARSR